MPETVADVLPAHPQMPHREQPRAGALRDSHALTDLARRAKEGHSNPILPHAEQASTLETPQLPLSGSARNNGPSEQVTLAPRAHAPELTTKRAWWKNVISKPIPMPRFIVKAIIDDYHKAFPYVFNDHPVRPNITYEHSMYFPPFDVIDVKVPVDSFSKKYPLFNEFVTQEVSEVAAGKRKLFGPLFGLAARITGDTSYRLLYFRAFGRWKNVERALERSYGKEERKRLVHRAYFLEGNELKHLEEKASEAGCPIQDAYRPQRETKGSIVDDSFWQKIPGRWKDVVVRLAAAAVAHVGKVTDVFALTAISIIDINAIIFGLRVLAHNLPLLPTIVSSFFPAYLALMLAMTGATSIGVMYHEMGHQMTKTLLDLNRKNPASPA